MLSQDGTAQRARWEVRWLAKGRIVSKNFGTDFAGAMALLQKALAANKNGATIICKNMGFPPPERLQPRHVRTVKRNARGRKETVEGFVRPMRRLNATGIWWCPYCAKLRKFVRKTGFVVSGVRVNEPGYHCPLCEISHRDANVKKWNPVAERLAINPERRTRKRLRARPRA